MNEIIFIDELEKLGISITKKQLDQLEKFYEIFKSRFNFM